MVHYEKFFTRWLPFPTIDTLHDLQFSYNEFKIKIKNVSHTGLVQSDTTKNQLNASEYMLSYQSFPSRCSQVVVYFVYHIQ